MIRTPGIPLRGGKFTCKGCPCHEETNPPVDSCLLLMNVCAAEAYEAPELTRRSEALDGLWTCGVRAYPEMGRFKDIKVNRAADCYPYWGREAVESHIAGLIARYRPDVMVTHDIHGEYGHGAHKVCAEMAMHYADTQDESMWQLKKLYLHLYKENPLVMDWRQPLASFGGQTAFDVAKAAFKCHASQRSNGLIVQDWGPHANNEFGLYDSSVGPDTGLADLFENLH